MACKCQTCTLCKCRNSSKAFAAQPPVDSTARVLLEIVKYIDEDRNRLSEEAREALSMVNAAVARQDRRWQK